MFTPNAGGPSMGEVLALLAAANQRITALNKEVVYLNAVYWELYKRFEGADEHRPLQG